MADIQIYGTLPGGGSDIEIATEINAQSTNAKAAGAKAVYDFVNAQNNVAFTLHTPLVVPQGEIEVDITDAQDTAMLEGFYNNLRAGNPNPLFYKAKLEEVYEEDETIYHYKTVETLNCMYIIDDADEERSCTIDCAAISPSYTMETFSGLGGTIHIVSFWRNSQGTWTYHEGFSNNLKTN